MLSSMGKARLTAPRTTSGGAEIGALHRTGAKHVEHCHRKQRRPDSVTANIEKIEREMIVVDPVIAEGVAAQFLLEGMNRQSMAKGVAKGAGRSERR